MSIKHRLSFKKKTRSLIKRLSASFINSSDTYVLQHLPESIGDSSHSFTSLRAMWTDDNRQNNNVLDTSLEAVKAFVGNAAHIHYCPGYFPLTASHIPDNEQFALVHLHANLYQPIISGLHYFYPKLSSGGIMIIHDYSSGAWPGVNQPVDEFLLNCPEKLIRIPDKSGTVAFRRYGTIYTNLKK